MDFLETGPSDGPTLILAHGAGAPMDSDFMNSVSSGLADHGVRVCRFEFPYMAERRTGGKKRPPNGKKVLFQTWWDALQEVTNRTNGPIVVGGKSMGGRIASMLADELGVAGLVCLGYPFHPPYKPNKLRTEHLASLSTPTLIVQGTRDRFGKPDEVAGYHLSDAISVVWIEDGDHSLKPRKRSGRTLDQNLNDAVEHVASFVHRLAGSS